MQFFTSAPGPRHEELGQGQDTFKITQNVEVTTDICFRECELAVGRQQYCAKGLRMMNLPGELRRRVFLRGPSLSIPQLNREIPPWQIAQKKLQRFQRFVGGLLLFRFLTEHVDTKVIPPLLASDVILRRVRCGCNRFTSNGRSKNRSQINVITYWSNNHKVTMRQA